MKLRSDHAPLATPNENSAEASEQTGEARARDRAGNGAHIKIDIVKARVWNNGVEIVTVNDGLESDIRQIGESNKSEGCPSAGKSKDLEDRSAANETSGDGYLLRSGVIKGRSI